MESIKEKTADEIEDKTIYFVQEFYRDEEKTLSQAIMYRVNDDRERDFYRLKVNPHLDILYRTRYLNKYMQEIKS